MPDESHAEPSTVHVTELAAHSARKLCNPLPITLLFGNGPSSFEIEVIFMNRFRLFLLLATTLAWPAVAAAQGLDTAKIESALGRPGQVTGDVYRVGFPRTDLHVTVHGLAIKPSLALGSWAAFMGTDERALVMGDLVLLDEELTPVMQKLTSSGFE